MRREWFGGDKRCGLAKTSLVPHSESSLAVHQRADAIRNWTEEAGGLWQLTGASIIRAGDVNGLTTGDRKVL